MGLEQFRIKRSAEKRASILEAARKCFMRDGYDRSSVEVVARNARVSTATVYRAFGSKLELFRAVLEEGIKGFRSRFESDQIPTLESVSVAYAELLSDQEVAGLLRAMFAEVGHRPELGKTFYGSAKGFVAGTFEIAIKQAKEAGEIWVRDEEIVRSSGQLMGMIEHATLWRLMLFDEPADEEPYAIATASVSALTRAYIKKH